MSDSPSEAKKPGALGAISRWFRRAPAETTPMPERSARAETPSRIGHYRITGTLGRGGMGIVYEAQDEKLGRAVAVKTMLALDADENSRKRFWREARAAASVSHPNVCQLFEIGEDRGTLFLAMELLQGESLADRLARGPMPLADVLPVGLGILAALEALHDRGIVHRDLKPSNVFLTPHGVKLLDFGLARTHTEAAARALDADANLTTAGIVIGTPRYMAPEQVTGEAVDGRADLFATATILFEMLAGRPAFAGRNAIEILHATLHEQPPALTGSSTVAALDRVIRHGLAKRPEARPESAAAMAGALRAVSGHVGDETPTLARTLTRLVVLPFRILRPDPETDFLAFSLADAIATSLAGSSSLVVRSSVAAARFAGDAPDLRALAAEVDVDRVVMGTLLRSGDRLQATAQLVEAPGGTLLTSHSVLSSLGDLFRLQADIARRVVDALALPLAGTPTPTPTPHAPRDPRAYELYLRANALVRGYQDLPGARDLYRRALDLDPTFAPAWAQLGRTIRVLGKFFDPDPDADARGEEAFRRALELDPRLTIAHKYYANLEADTGHARTALARLLDEARRHGNDPELFAGLVHACRYCGLIEESIAAHDEARRLDPNVPSGVEQTVLMTGDEQRLLAIDRPQHLRGGDRVIRVVAMGLAGRHEEARAALIELRGTSNIPAFQGWTAFLLAWLERRPDGMAVERAALGAYNVMTDPEAIFQEGWLYTDAGDPVRGLDRIRASVARGYYPVTTLALRHFDGLRGSPAFADVVAQATAGRDEALAAFRAGGGDRLLGLG